MSCCLFYKNYSYQNNIVEALTSIRSIENLEEIGFLKI